MPLPMFDKRKIGSIMLERMGKKGAVEVKTESLAPEAKMDPAIMEAAEDVLRAVESKSVIDLAKALMAAFEICDAMPHEEGPHIGE